MSAVNVTVGRPRRDAVPDSIISVIKIKNQLDIQLYEYALEMLSKKANCKGERTGVFGRAAAVRPVGPSHSPSDISKQVMDDERVSGIERSLQLINIDLAAAFIVWQRRLPQIACQLLEFRPLFGYRLATIGKILPNNAQIIAVDFRDDVFRNAHARGSCVTCENNLVNLFGRDRVRIVGSECERTRLLCGDDDVGQISVGIVSRPFSKRDVVNELRFLSRFLSEDGFVMIEEVNNPDWMQSLEGVIEFLREKPHIEPFLIQQGTIWMCRPTAKYLYQCVARGFAGADINCISLAGYSIIRLY